MGARKFGNGRKPLVGAWQPELRPYFAARLRSAINLLSLFWRFRYSSRLVIDVVVRPNSLAISWALFLAAFCASRRLSSAWGQCLRLSFTNKPTALDPDLLIL